MSVQSSFEDGVLTISRRYDRSMDEVFSALVEVGKRQERWGCQNTTHVTSEIETEVGGKYEHAMTITGVGVHPIKGRLTAYEPPVRLAYEMPGMNRGEFLQVIVEFVDRDGQTEVTLTQSVLPPELQDVVKAGWTASFERLDRFFNGERRTA